MKLEIYIYISHHPNITMEIIEKYPNKPRDWYWISYNPNITMEIIEKCPDKPWHWFIISDNKFNYDKRIEYEKKDKAARIIQKACENWLYKPILKDGKYGIVPRLAIRNDQNII